MNEEDGKVWPAECVCRKMGMKQKRQVSRVVVKLTH